MEVGGKQEPKEGGVWLVGFGYLWKTLDLQGLWETFIRVQIFGEVVQKPHNKQPNKTLLTDPKTVLGDALQVN